MGMAASQSTLLQLTSRKNTIGYELTCLSNDKLALSREMTKLAKSYQESLNLVCYKWSNNAGITYIDLSYSNLMKPSAMNQNKPYLLTDTDGFVVIDSEYKKYAEMISPTGEPNGKWDSSIRTQILSELTGIDAEKINNASNYQNNITANENIINQLIEEEPVKPTKTTYIRDFIENLGSATGISSAFNDGDSWADAYDKKGSINIGNSTTAATNLQTLVNHIATKLGAYLDDPKNLQTACTTFYNSQIGIIQDSSSDGNKQSLSSDQTPLNGNSSGFTINVTQMLDTIMGSYAQLNGSCERSGYSNDYTYTWNDIDSAKYQTWATEHAEWQTKYDNAKNSYDNAVSENGQLFTAEEERLINFYDTLFSSIAEKGWVYNTQASDTDYLNQMLQNNIYTITSVERNSEYDEDNNEYIWNNDYSMNIASNCSNIFAVADSAAREEAMVDYEYKKSIINTKEQKIDNRMNELETEQAAINQMIQSVEQVKNDNNDRTMDAMG